MACCGIVVINIDELREDLFYKLEVYDLDGISPSDRVISGGRSYGGETTVYFRTINGSNRDYVIKIFDNNNVQLGFINFQANCC